MYGFFGKVLILNVSDRSCTTEALDEAFLLAGMGGKGLGSRLLLDRNPAGVDPFFHGKPSGDRTRTGHGQSRPWLMSARHVCQIAPDRSLQ